MLCRFIGIITGIALSMSLVNLIEIVFNLDRDVVATVAFLFLGIGFGFLIDLGRGFKKC